MPAKIDLTGQRFGRLVAVEVVIRKRPSGSTRRLWRCLCDCGKKSIATSTDLKSGKHRSCGCLHIEAITTHGYSYTPTRRSWSSMVQRCTNPKAPGFHRYGGRGIAVCERWRTFTEFLADMGERPSKKHTLDRINNDAGYEPGNCRWSTSKEQAQNREKTAAVMNSHKRRSRNHLGRFV